MNAKATHVVVLICAVLLAACGQVATPFVTQRPPATEDVAMLPTDIVLEPTVVTEEAVETEVVEVATELATVAPTEVPTEETTEIVAIVEPTVEVTVAVATEEATVEATAAVVASAEGVGDPVAGQTLFVTGDVANGALACSTCHNVATTDVLIGPSLLGIADRAGERVPGEDAVEYLHQSIVDPNAYVVEGFVPGLMPPVYVQVYSEEQINDLVAYLLTLES